MKDQRLRKFALAIGWVLAFVLAVLYLGSKYQISIKKSASKEDAKTATSSPSPGEKEGKAKKLKAELPQVQLGGQKSQTTKPKQWSQMRPLNPERKSTEPIEPPTFAKAEANQAAPTPAPRTETKELSTEEIFKLASPSVILLEVFDDENRKRGSGSGFVASPDGSVVTNYHVIRGAWSATARFQDGTSARVLGVVGFDRERDVAVIKLGTGNLPSLELGDSDNLRVGQRLIAIGSPLGFQNTVTEGILSGLRGGAIQMSTPISPGSSGGPVFNTHGEVVGITVATIVGGQNLNFAVPINWAKPHIGGYPSASLVDVARESTVVNNFLTGTISVEAREAKEWPIEVDPNRMSNAELHGSFNAAGGLTDNIRVLVMFGEKLLYDSGRVRQGEVHLPLIEKGQYQLVIDNRGSLMFRRSVEVSFALRYVR